MVRVGPQRHGGAARRRMWSMLRVRLESLFAVAAAAGSGYFLYEDYKVAHDSTALHAPAAGNDDDNNVDLFGTEEEFKATEQRAGKVNGSCKKKESLSSYFHDGVVSRRVMDSLTRRKLFSATPATSAQAFGSMAPPVNKLLREEGCGRACRVKGKSDTLLGVLEDFHSDVEKFQCPSKLLLLVMSADELSLHCSRSIHCNTKQTG